MPIYLGVDLGTSGTKTLAINEAGTVLAQASTVYPCHHPKPLWSEQDPEDWWRATVKTIRTVVRQGKFKPADVKGIGLSGQMHGSVFLDKDSRVIRPALLWNDGRTAAECDEIERRAGGRKKLVRMVANPALTGFQAPKILWLRNHEPRNFDRTVRVLLPKDEVRRRLTGELATEVTDASGTLLLDVVKRKWSGPLLSKLELDVKLLPEVYESEDVTGKLLPNVAEKLGLTTDCVVVGGAGDCAAGAVGNGVVNSGAVLSSLGTSGVVFCHSETPEYDPEGRLHTFCHAVRGKWHMMGVTLSAAGSLEWFAKAICPELSKSRKPLFETLLAEASQTPVGASGLFFLPYLAGERTPHADPLARGAFVGLTHSHTRGHLVRALLEGVTYSLRDCLEIMTALGVPAMEVRATGGGSKSDLWRQMQADVFGKRIVRMTADEGPAYGVALLAATGCGEFKSVEEACLATVRTDEVSRPNAKCRKRYDRGAQVYQRLYDSLREDYQAIAALES